MAAIDAANSGDPNQIAVRGALRPKELAHAQLVCAWIARLVPEASEALQLAARAHHLRRWEIPRSNFPADRAGYHRWRTTLQEHHARLATEILREQGYDDATQARVQDLVRKRGLGRGDAEVQALEDALCLVFLETQLAELATRMPDEKLVDVLRKTLRKMSPAGKRYAVGLEQEPRERSLLARALQA